MKKTILTLIAIASITAVFVVSNGDLNQTASTRGSIPDSIHLDFF